MGRAALGGLEEPVKTAIVFFTCTIGLLASALFVWVGVEVIVTPTDLGPAGFGFLLLVIFVPIGLVCLRGLWRASKRFGPRS